jgi:chromate transporter
LLNVQFLHLRELAGTFLYLGLIGFGGPAAHIALMRDELVRKRAWLSDSEFLDLIGVANLIPGPTSTEVAMHVGLRRAGVPGLITAGVCFIGPAAMLVGLLAAAYVRFRTLPHTGLLLYGIKPVLIAIILQALLKLVPQALKTGPLVVGAIAAAVLALAGVHEFAVIFGIGAAFAVTPSLKVVEFQLAWSFLKIGSLLFGSGYVLVAYLRSEFVERLQWITEQQLLDAIAAGQLTPGPLFTTATFIGYLVAGPAGAVIATIAIFLPAFVLVGISGRLITLLRSSRAASAFLDGVNAASMAVLVVVTAQLGRASVVDWYSALIFVLAGLLLFGARVNGSWLILGGAIAGLVRPALG